MKSLPCINTLLLNRYLAGEEQMDAYADRIQQARDDATAAKVTMDDVYEFGCALETGGIEGDYIRARLAKLLTALNDAKYTGTAVAELVGYALLEMLNDNRAERAELKTIKDMNDE